MDKVEQYLIELENSSHIEQIARRLGVDLETVKSFIEPFKKKAELEYPNHYKFISHFKNYVNVELNKKQKGTFTEKIFKKSQEAEQIFKQWDGIKGIE